MNEIRKIATQVFNIESESVKELANLLNQNFDKAIELLFSCQGRVVVCGIGKSGLVGKKIAATLASTGTPSFFYIHPKRFMVTWAC